MSAVDLIVLPEHVDNMLDPEDGTESFILSHEAEADQAVPLGEVDGRGRVLRLNPDNTRLDLGRWLETVSRHLDQMIDSCEKLHID